MWSSSLLPSSSLTSTWTALSVTFASPTSSTCTHSSGIAGGIAGRFWCGGGDDDAEFVVVAAKARWSSGETPSRAPLLRSIPAPPPASPPGGGHIDAASAAVASFRRSRATSRKICRPNTTSPPFGDDDDSASEPRGPSQDDDDDNNDEDEDDNDDDDDDDEDAPPSPAAPPLLLFPSSRCRRRRLLGAGSMGKLKRTPSMTPLPVESLAWPRRPSRSAFEKTLRSCRAVPPPPPVPVSRLEGSQRQSNNGEGGALPPR